MGTSKTHVFSDAQNKIASVAKAIGHPARIAILQYILKHNECICNDLVEELPLSQSTISQHLKELKQVGLIKGEVEGPSMCYCINEEVWDETKDIILNLFTSYKGGKSCC
jgi:DNA-binding transcriptional ArsR family regulator